MMVECIGCGLDTDIEYSVVVDGIDDSRVYELCGFCGDKVIRFIEKEL